MIILGIDPGIARVGWGVIEVQGSKILVKEYDCFETPKTDDEGKRLVAIHKFLEKLIKDFKPDVVAVEELYFTTNVKTAIRVAQARGVILLVAAQAGLEVYPYNPLSIKTAVTGYGKADKNQVMAMVKQILKLDKNPKLDDTADALAVALSHAFSYKLVSKV
jgi:crossover junction endodeoxyribonuclease RuvC